MFLSGQRVDELCCGVKCIFDKHSKIQNTIIRSCATVYCDLTTSSFVSEKICVDVKKGNGLDSWMSYAEDVYRAWPRRTGESQTM